MNRPTGNTEKAIKPKKIEAVLMTCPYCKEKFIEEYHKYMNMVRWKKPANVALVVSQWAEIVLNVKDYGKAERR